MVPIAQKRRVAGENVTLKKKGGGGGEKKQCDAVRVMKEGRKCCSSKEPGTGRVKIMWKHIGFTPLVQ